MALDFAKRQTPRKKTRKRKANKKNSLSHWHTFFIGLIFGVFFSFILYLKFMVPEPIVQQQIVDNSGVPSDETNRTANLDFYYNLPAAEVVVDVELVSIPTPEEVTIESYRLQAGSFQTQQDAENRRAKIILLNLDSEIVPAIVRGRTRYRVQVGPFAGRANVNNARDILAENNIETMVLLIK